MLFNLQSGFVICLLLLNSLLEGINAEPQCKPQSTNSNCQQLEQIKLSMDTTWNPCGDFYDYACTKWSSQHPSNDYANLEQLMDYKLNTDLITILTVMDNYISDMEFLNRTYLYFLSCIKAPGSNPYKQYLDIIKPGENVEWPLLWKLQDGNVGNPWPMADEFDVCKFLGHLWKYGFKAVLIRSEIYETQNETVVTLAEPKKTLLTLTQMRNTLIVVGFSPSEAHTHALRLADVQSLWNSMYDRFSSPARPMLESVKPTMDYAELEEIYPMLHTYIRSSGMRDLKKNLKIEISNLDYFDFLSAKLKHPQEKEDLCNLIMLYFLEYLLRDKNGKGFSKLQCIKEVRHKLELPLSFLYYEYMFKPKETNRNLDIKTMFQQTRDGLIQLLEDNFKYLDMAKLRSHIKETSINLGNQPTTVRNSYIKQLFADIPQLSPDNFYYNHLELLRHKMLTSLRRLDYRTHVMYSAQYTIGDSSEPFYDGRRNMLVLPLSLLRPPIYQPDLHAIFKWSALGFLLAENIFHTQTAGLNYLSPPPPPTGEGYFNSPNFHNAVIDLKLARKVGAAAVAYNSYRHFHRQQLQPEFTDEIPWQQLFFLNLAQMFCVNNADNNLSRRNRFDLNNITAALPHFKEAFQCRRHEFFVNNL
ncbi:neprilysin-1-like [Musca autumnalis]|uniref:neprilysin-1-like n=1 Tax=Musca autumnalis TaxID=221902 RepID=UPI003CF06472